MLHPVTRSSCSPSGSYLVAPLDVCARAMGGVLWLNAAIFAYGVALAALSSPRHAGRAAACCRRYTAGGGFCHGLARTVVLIAEGAFFLFRSIAALLMDVRNRQEDITAFSTIETTNVSRYILYWIQRGRPLPMNRCMRKNLVELHMPTDLGDMSGHMERPAQTQHANVPKAAGTVCGLSWIVW